MAVLLVASGATALLLDPDLPVHLAMGRWIVRHGAVPFTEPFAWTRAGDPYYAYSWAIESAYFLVHESLGVTGLRVLHGLFIAAAAAVMLVLARAARWSPWTGLLLAILNVTIAAFLASHLRPQIVLFISVPLAWACAYRILESERIHWPLLVLLGASALAANSHLLFPLTAAPWMLLVTHPRRDLRRSAALVLVTVAGWMLSPYALVWPKVFQLNFAPNPLFTHPTPISELQPGVQAISQAPLALVVVLALALMPWALSTVWLTRRERIVAAAAWLIGLLAFAYAVRALLIWWMLVLPTFAAVVELLALVPKREIIVRAQKFCLYAILVCLVAGRVRNARSVAAANPDKAVLFTPFASSVADPLARWLECNGRADARGRILTVFRLGSYLAWRLPAFSSSIDGRNIFPDSVARAESYNLSRSNNATLGPWRSADLAIVTLDYPVAAVLDTATGWRRTAASDTTGRPPFARAALWVRTAWWDRNRATNPTCPATPPVLSRTAQYQPDPVHRTPGSTHRAPNTAQYQPRTGHRAPNTALVAQKTSSD
ncbi:MAG: hypothetical protein H7Z74_15580 [Anaerolineae bacterium]|nr:hypothetical protein [Gemmatimonadaceae bacterium]